ncbi:laminin subunit beta 4 [Turdus rufiventris]|nr:laminin subunit beta 4 [Turdus rufiventris]
MRLGLAILLHLIVFLVLYGIIKYQLLGFSNCAFSNKLSQVKLNGYSLQGSRVSGQNLFKRKDPAEEKCFLCDSRYPYNPYTQHNSHMVENVITTFEPERKKKWWQSENGIDHVSIRLDLETLFQFSHLILTFKTFRPAAMLVERSTDFGQTWKVFRYFAHDCAASFPNISSGPAKSVGDVVCDSRYSDIEPSTEGEVVLKALDPSFEIENPYVPYIQDLITLTNLRINFTKLHTLGDAVLGRRHSDPLEKYYYAIYEMVVRGSCFCNGHASQCCNCNSHSSRCHFDMAVYQASGGVSGGVCEDCQDNTTGQHCDQCKPSFYQDPLKAISDPQACLRYWGLGNSLYGCSPCDCDIGGSQNNLCSLKDGQCECLPNIVSRQCNEPAPGYFFLPLDYYIYEAEHAKPLSGSAPLVQPSTLPRCDIYFQKKGYEFMIENGKIVLNRNKKRTVRKSGLEQGAMQFGQDWDSAVVFRQPSAERAVTWTGHGFARVPSGAGLRFAISNVPFAMDFDITVRYEPELLEDWLASVAIQPAGVLSGQHCKNKVLSQEPHELILPATKRIAILQTPVCLEPGTEYFVDVYFSQLSASDKKAKSFILIDSLGLIPRISSVDNLCSEKDLDEYEKYHCIEIASEVGPHVLPEACARLIVSLSARIHNGAVECCRPAERLGKIPDMMVQVGVLEEIHQENLDDIPARKQWQVGFEVPRQPPGSIMDRLAGLSSSGNFPACKCNPQGSLNVSCSKLGGQCHCKANVVGRCCDTCSAGSYGFGFHGCYACECHPQGSLSALCDQVTGQCSCRRDVNGQRCSRCLAGYFGFPHCRPCPCNGHAELCDPLTGECLDCRGFTAGSHCERCMDGYYGNPLDGEPCHPCMCPGSPTSNRYFAHSCYQDSQSAQLVCNCLEGYSACECNLEGTRQPVCDKATGACNCRAGVTGRLCDQCGRGFEKDFPSCHQCHLCFDQWDTEIAALAQTVQGLMRFAAKLEDKGGRMLSCDMHFKAFEDAISETERILRHPVLSLEALSGIRDFKGYLQQKVAQMNPLPSLPFEFPDFNKNIEDIGEEADLVFELLQQKIHLHQSFQYLNFKEAVSNIRKHSEVSLLAEQRTRGTASIVRHSEDTRNDALTMLDHQVLNTSNVLQQLRMIKSPGIQNLNEKVEGIRKMAEDSKLKGSQFNGELEMAVNKIEVDGEIIKEFIQKVKDFLLDESAPPEDIEKVANYVLQINLPLTPQELTGMLGKLQSIMNHCEKYKLNNKRNNNREDAQTLLMEAQEAGKAAKSLLPVDAINNKLKNVVKSQGHSKNTIIKLNEEIRDIRTHISQAESQVNKTNDKLNDLSAKQTEMEDESATWQAKMLMNKNQATKARAEAEAAHKQAQNVENEFTDVKRKYTILQEKLKTQGTPKVTLEKVKRLKEEAEKLAEETEKKIKRITGDILTSTVSDLEKKLQELNQTKQDKAEQLRQLEEQVIAIKNEIMEQESKYATCKS